MVKNEILNFLGINKPKSFSVSEISENVACCNKTNLYRKLRDLRRDKLVQREFLKVKNSRQNKEIDHYYVE